MVPKGPAHEKEPDIEWWDQVILDSQDYTDWKIRDGAITSLIEHPIQVILNQLSMLFNLGFVHPVTGRFC